MRYLGIDYGSKKIGVAISDDEAKLAFPFSIIQNTKDKNEVIKQIIKIIKEKEIQNIIIGESVNLNGEKNNIFSETKNFLEILKLELKKENIFCNFFFEKEWLSTVEARRYDDRKNADDSAAAIILQRFLEKLNIKNKR